MGDSTSSMFIFFAIAMAAWIIGAGGYALVQMLRRKIRRRRDG